MNEVLITYAVLMFIVLSSDQEKDRQEVSLGDILMTLFFVMLFTLLLASYIVFFML